MKKKCREVPVEREERFPPIMDVIEKSQISTGKFSVRVLTAQNRCFSLLITDFIPLCCRTLYIQKLIWLKFQLKCKDPHVFLCGQIHNRVLLWNSHMLMVWKWFHGNFFSIICATNSYAYRAGNTNNKIHQVKEKTAQLSWQNTTICQSQKPVKEWRVSSTPRRYSHKSEFSQMLFYG